MRSGGFGVSSGIVGGRAFRSRTSAGSPPLVDRTHLEHSKKLIYNASDVEFVNVRRPVLVSKVDKNKRLAQADVLM